VAPAGTHVCELTEPGSFIVRLSYLDQKPLKQLDGKEQRLMHLLLSFAHAAYAVEIQGDNEARHAQFQRHLKITRAPAPHLGAARGSRSLKILTAAAPGQLFFYRGRDFRRMWRVAR
jgi:hypothetical protein